MTQAKILIINYANIPELHAQIMEKNTELAQVDLGIIEGTELEYWNTTKDGPLSELTLPEPLDGCIIVMDQSSWDEDELFPDDLITLQIHIADDYGDIPVIAVYMAESDEVHTNIDRSFQAANDMDKIYITSSEESADKLIKGIRFVENWLWFRRNTCPHLIGACECSREKKRMTEIFHQTWEDEC